MFEYFRWLGGLAARAYTTVTGSSLFVPVAALALLAVGAGIVSWGYNAWSDKRQAEEEARTVDDRLPGKDKQERIKELAKRAEDLTDEEFEEREKARRVTEPVIPKKQRQTQEADEEPYGIFEVNGHVFVGRQSVIEMAPFHSIKLWGTSSDTMRSKGIVLRNVLGQTFPTREKAEEEYNKSKMDTRPASPAFASWGKVSRFKWNGTLDEKWYNISNEKRFLN